MRARVGMLVSAAWLVLAVATSAVAQEDDAAKVRGLEMKWTDSYKQRKIDILASLLSDDFVITVEDGADCFAKSRTRATRRCSAKTPKAADRYPTTPVVSPEMSPECA